MKASSNISSIDKVSTWEIQSFWVLTEIMNRQRLYSANFKKQPHRKASELCFYRDGNRNEFGASSNRRSGIGVLGIRLNLDPNVIHQERQQWLPAFMRPEAVWSTTSIEEEYLIEYVNGMRVSCLSETISSIRIKLKGWGRRTVLASWTIISHIRSEWKANSSESSSMLHACSSCKGLCRYCSVDIIKIKGLCNQVESLTRAVVCWTEDQKPSESSIKQWKCRRLIVWKN